MPPLVTGLYRALMWAGHLVCHQMPARSPHLFGAQLPLCWRCTGIALGACALLAWLLAKRRLPALWLSAALSLLMPLDLLYAILTRGDGDNARRLMTGALWGFFAAGFVLHLFALAHARLAPNAKRRAGAKRSDPDPASAEHTHAPAGAAFDGTV